ncbi:THO complex subunit 5 [Clonorchis sinensis]|uniref:THO complex subunit 5 n=1 Tax=Clonorchis sinensis TaxID=79923 RepID=G7Y4D1_CLOSI|nr:THO complex subunit 5 [Clonorchis sinensis]
MSAISEKIGYSHIRCSRIVYIGYQEVNEWALDVHPNMYYLIGLSGLTNAPSGVGQIIRWKSQPKIRLQNCLVTDLPTASHTSYASDSMVLVFQISKRYPGLADSCTDIICHNIIRINTTSNVHKSPKFACPFWNCKRRVERQYVKEHYLTGTYDSFNYVLCELQLKTPVDMNCFKFCRAVANLKQRKPFNCGQKWNPASQANFSKPLGSHCMVTVKAPMQLVGQVGITAHCFICAFAFSMNQYTPAAQRTRNPLKQLPAKYHKLPWSRERQRALDSVKSDQRSNLLLTFYFALLEVVLASDVLTHVIGEEYGPKIDYRSTAIPGHVDASLLTDTALGVRFVDQQSINARKSAHHEMADSGGFESFCLHIERHLTRKNVTKRCTTQTGVSDTATELVVRLIYHPQSSKMEAKSSVSAIWSICLSGNRGLSQATGKNSLCLDTIARVDRCRRVRKERLQSMRVSRSKSCSGLVTCCTCRIIVSRRVLSSVFNANGPTLDLKEGYEDYDKFEYLNCPSVFFAYRSADTSSFDGLIESAEIGRGYCLHRKPSRSYGLSKSTSEMVQWLEREFTDRKQTDERSKNSFYWEESNVQLNGAQEDWKAFKLHCMGLRESVWTAWECKKNNETINSSTFASLLIAVKELNRRTQFRIRKARDRTAEQKLGVDKLHLNLQNFLYEVAHLEDEIKTCLEFKSQHERLNLIPVEEFCQATGRSVPTASTHEGTLERLYWENEQRKKLAADCNSLQEAVQTTEREIQQKRDYLASFGPKLKEVSESTISTQEAMNLPFTKEERQYKLAHLLPSALYILYAHLKSYISITDHVTQIAVEIEGDAQLAKAINQTAGNQSTPSGLGTAVPDAEDSDADLDAPTEKKRKTGRHKGKLQDTSDRPATSNKMATHPLSVVVRLVHECGAAASKPRFEIQLTFFWVLSVKLVAVRLHLTALSDQSPSSTSGRDLLCSEQLLCNLDWTATSTMKGSRRGSDWPLLPADYQWDACQSIGRPFLWAQELCGSHCLLESNPTVPPQDSTSSTASIIDSDVTQSQYPTEPLPRYGRVDTWLNALKRRLNDRILLTQEDDPVIESRATEDYIGSTLSGNFQVAKSFGAQVRSRSSSSQKDFMVPTGKINACQLGDHVRTNTFMDVNSTVRYQASFRFAAIATFLTCEPYESLLCTECASVWVALPPEYPQTPPLLVVEHISMGSKSTGKSAGAALSDLVYMDLESELNCYWHEFFVNRGSEATEVNPHEPPRSNILSCQLARCASCLEALWKGSPVTSRSGDHTLMVAGHYVK